MPTNAGLAKAGIPPISAALESRPDKYRMTERMRWTPLLLMLAAIAGVPAASASPDPGLCDVLRAFVSSVGPDQTREFTYRTSWGSNFKDAATPAMMGKRCEHGGHVPAEKVCAYLIEHGATEFAGYNFMSAVECLSPDTRFAPRLVLAAADFSFSYGTEERGALIDVVFKEDPVAGGMMFRLVADGY